MTTTAKDWRTMAAGRELDALVAERVMGWQWRDYWSANEPVCGLFPPTGGGSFSDHDQHSEFSTDIAAAWQVVDKLREMDWLVVVKAMPAGIPFLIDNGDSDLKLHREAFVSLTYVGWQRPNAPPEAHSRHFHTHPMHHADTVPHAICRAALAATEAR